MAASTKVSDMCRLCGTDTLNVVRHHIFEGEGQVKKSAQKISECLPLHIAAEDPLPKNICGECSYKLDLMSDFREKAVKTDVMLVSLVEGVKPEIPDDDDDGPDHEIDNDFRSDTPVEQPEQQTEPEVLIKEEEAQQPQQPEKRPGRKAANKRPIQESDMEEEEEEAPAKKRGRKPKEKETAPAASATTSASTNPPKENTGNPSDPANFELRPCAIKLEDISDKLALLKHTDDTHLVLTCKICEQCFLSADELNCHVESEHLYSVDDELDQNIESEDTSERDCLRCGLMCLSNSELSAHFIRKHSVCNQYQCTQCLTVMGKRDLLKHSELHGLQGKCMALINPESLNFKQPVDRQILCILCFHLCSNSYDYSMHLKLNHLLAVVFQCPICQKFIKKRNRKSHRMFHARKEKKLKVQQRLAESEAKQKLRNQQKAETINKQLQRMKASIKESESKKSLPIPVPASNLAECGFCQMSFPTVEELVTHQYSHMTNKEGVRQVWPCGFCSELFFTRNRIELHMMKEHAKEKSIDRHCCKICYKIFDTKPNLEKHVWTYHLGVEKPVRQPKPESPPKPFSCMYCSKEFVLEVDCEAHELNHETISLSVSGDSLDKRKVGSVAAEADSSNCAQTASMQVECAVCHKSFDSEPLLLAHVTRNHISSLTCDICKRQFWSAQEMELHYRGHLTESRARENSQNKNDSLSCVVCRKRFCYSGNLHFHQKKEHVVNFTRMEMDKTCKFCKRTFTDTVKLECHHMMDHSLEASNTSKYNEQSHDKQHNLTVKCDICDRTFSGKDILESHILNIHTSTSAPTASISNNTSVTCAPANVGLDNC
ncbi:zinc finger protein Xfin-like isoform X3 [Cloeon dipterum]|uniref:zinc finger protein Xfin-like isoform X3 n=1 Tax=Cloeon dipterum TaxID=197152 RepID=UPI00321FF03E